MMLTTFSKLTHLYVGNLNTNSPELQQQFLLKGVSLLYTHINIGSSQQAPSVSERSETVRVCIFPCFTGSVEQTPAQWLAWLHLLFGVGTVLPTPPGSQRQPGWGTNLTFQ